MARPQLKDTLPASPATRLPETPGSWTRAMGDGDRQDGSVGQMQAELARRLVQGMAAETMPVMLEERVICFLSIAGGYTVLLAAYVGIIVLVLH